MSCPVCFHGLGSCLPQPAPQGNAGRASSLLKRPPGRITCPATGLHLLEVTPRDIHRIQPRLPLRTLGLTGEHDHPAVRRPCRPLIEEGRGQQPFFAAIGAHHADMEPALGLLGKGDQITARRPDWRAIAPLPETDPPRLTTTCGHY